MRLQTIALLVTVVITAAASACRDDDHDASVAVATAAALPGDLIARSPAASPDAGAAPPSAKAEQREQDELDQRRRDEKAAAVLAKMDERLRKLDRFEIEARTSTDYIVDRDLKLQRNASIEMSVDRPDRLTAKVIGDRGSFRLFYDGKTLSILDLERHFYAQMQAPPTIAEVIVDAQKRKAVEMPLVDFVTRRDRLADASAYGYIGEGEIDNKKVDHVAVRQQYVDWQVWVDQETHLPLKYVITTKDDPAKPQFIAELEWDTAPPKNPRQFEFTPPAGATKIEWRDVTEAAKSKSKAKGKRDSKSKPEDNQGEQP